MAPSETAPSEIGRARRTSLALALLALMAAVSLSACSVRRGAVRVDARHVRTLLRQVERETRCPATRLTATMLTPEVAQVHGCGMVREFSFISRGRQRGRWAPIRPLWERASAELACPAPQLVITAPSATQRDVAGCGRAAVYGLTCAAECIWTLRRWAGPEGGGAVVPGAVAAAPGAGAAGAGAGVRDTMSGETAGASEIAPPEGASAEAAPEGASAGSSAETPATPPAVAEAPPADPMDPASFAVPDPPTPGSPEASLRAFLDDRRAAIRGCTGPGPVVVRASWEADGSVVFELEPPLAGTAADACLRTALGRARFEGASGPGMVRHSLL